MLKDITLGQYYPGSTFIHKLDARIKIAATLFYIVALFLVKDISGYGVVLGFLVLVIGASGVPLKFILRGLKPIFAIIIFTFVLNLFMIDGKVLWQWGIMKITEESLNQAVFMALRLIFLILGSSLLTFTTKPMALTDGMEKLLNPFRKIGVPAHELAMMMTIALRFIPTLLAETDKIMKAQMARGADFESGNLLTRAKSLVPLLVPLFISAFRIAQDLAMAMEARCYRGGDNRTRMTAMELHWQDGVASFITIIFIGSLVYLRYFY